MSHPDTDDDSPPPYVPGLDPRRWRAMRYWQEVDSCLYPDAPAEIEEVAGVMGAGWTPHQAANLIRSQRVGDKIQAGVKPAWMLPQSWN